MTRPALPVPGPLAARWRLDPGVVFLNHGSFGACPDVVLDAQHAHRARMEAEPVRFFCRDLFDGLDRSRRAVGEMLGARPEDVVFVPNATTGVATVLDSLATGRGLADPRPLGPGDEILAGSLEYPGCLANLRRTAERTGATARAVEIPVLDGEGPMTAERYSRLILEAVTDRTRVCLLSHIISPTGWVTPGADLVRALESRGVVTILDGAHGPGAVEIDLRSIRPAFYTTNAHKWLCAPKGAAVLYVRPDLQDGFRPQTLSIYDDGPDGRLGRSRYNLDFDYVGTDDYSAAITIADAIEGVPEIADMPWPEITERNRELALRARDLIRDRLGTPAASDDAMIGPMAMVELPVVPPERRERLNARPTMYVDALQDALLDRHAIQIPVWRPWGQAPGSFDGRRFVRLSAQLYNSIEQYEYLTDALKTELARELDQTSP